MMDCVRLKTFFLPAKLTKVRVYVANKTAFESVLEDGNLGVGESSFKCLHNCVKNYLNSRMNKASIRHVN